MFLMFNFEVRKKTTLGNEYEAKNISNWWRRLYW